MIVHQIKKDLSISFFNFFFLTNFIKMYKKNNSKKLSLIVLINIHLNFDI